MPQNEVRTTYTAIGRRQIIQETMFIDTITYHNTDPLAQTFSFSEDTLVPSIGVFFGSKDDVPILCQLRNVVNGYPGPISYGSRVLQSSEVQVSNDGSVETKFTFSDPILCSRDIEYCFVLLTEGAQYRAFVAKMGEKDLVSNAYVPAQPFIGGTLFSSSDNAAWSPHQDMDLKFKIYKAQFDDQEAVINFPQLTDIEAAEIILIANQLVPAGTSVIWEVSQTGTSNWIPMNVNQGTTALPTKYTNCFIRARLTGNGKSPILNLGAIMAAGIKFALSSAYVNRNVVTLANFNKVQIWADVYTPPGTTVSFKFSTDDGVTWEDATPSVTSPSTPVSSEYTQFHFENTLDTPKGQFRVKVLMTGTETAYPQVRRLMTSMQ